MGRQDEGELAGGGEVTPPEGELARRFEGLRDAARAAGREEELARAAEAFLEARRAAPAAGCADPAQGDEPPGRFGMIGASPAMQAVFRLIERVAPSEVPVLIRGETGTGKELVARALHEGSPRRRGPFLAENCAAVPAGLLESELFGHVRGAFTGAIADRAGHFVAAAGGTLFLDEVGDMPLEMQVKLLRALETREVRPVGASRTVRIDVRLVAATNQDLETMIRERRFREDLAYRLDVMRIDLPPLRERTGDVPLLVRGIARRLARDLGRPVPGIEPEALAALARHPWPGNVRQLENEIRRALALGTGIIRTADLSPAVAGGAQGA